MAADEPVLRVRDLRVHFPTDDGLVRSVDGLSFDVAAGQIVGIVGESGSGKSVTGKAVLGLHGGSRARVSGEIRWDGRDLVAASEREWRRLRGAEIAMIFQGPLSSLHPYFTIGRQISEAYRAHHRVRPAVARAHALAMLERVGFADPARRYDDFPHQFSGGMRQRAMIAMALVAGPRLLVADEPTTALDVTVQAQILALITQLCRETGTAVLLVTHDLGVVAQTCDEVVVMYAGECVEQGPVGEIFARPRMPYTWGLLGSMPRADRPPRDRLEPIPGQPPSLLIERAGCAFGPRCAFRSHVPDDRCARVHPGFDAGVRCHLSADQRDSVRPAGIGAVS